MPEDENEELKRGDQIAQRAQEKFEPGSGLQNDARQREQEVGAGYVNAGIDQLEAHLRDHAGEAQAAEVEQGGQQTGRNDREGLFRHGETDLKSAGRKALVKKFGPTGGIIGAIVMFFFGIGVFISPSLALVHLKEVLTEDLNDAFEPMNRRTKSVLRAKLDDMGKGRCTIPKIRCGIRGMTDRQVRAFERAGVIVETDGDTITGRNKIKSLSFAVSDVARCGNDCKDGRLVIDDPTKLRKYIGDRMINSQLRRAYNPLFYSLWDKTGAEVFKRIKADRGERLKGTTAKEIDESIDSTLSSESTELDTRSEKEKCTEDDKKCEKRNQDREKQENEAKEKLNSGERGSSLLSRTARSVGAFGGLKNACGLATTLDAVQAGAKVLQALQLAKYAQTVLLGPGDSIKASFIDPEGGPTPEVLSHLGDKAIVADTNRTVIDETSGGSVNPDTGKLSGAKEVPNPHYGKTAYDAPLVKMGLYNDAPTLTSRDQQYLVGGGLLGTFSEIYGLLDTILPGDRQARAKFCNGVNHPVMTGIEFIVTAGTFGVGSLTMGALASVPFMVAQAVAESYLKDMLAGEVVSSQTQGVDMGNAIFSGTATILGTMSMMRGMKPATSISELRTAQAQKEKAQQEYIAMDIEDAKSTPFDVMNQYSFAGMLARKLLPVRVASQSFASTLTSGLPKLFSLSTLAASPTAKAVGDFNPDRYRICVNDAGYNETGIVADGGCNVRYVLSEFELKMETDPVYEYMLINGFIDEEHNIVEGKDYEDFLINCANREAGWGEVDEVSLNTGKGCMDSSVKLSNFRIYTMDRSIEQGMDEGPEIETSSATNYTGEGARFKIGTFNILGKSHRAGDWQQRANKSIAAINRLEADVVAFQEMQPPQQGYFDKNLKGYERSKHGKTPDSIMWRTESSDGRPTFRKVGQGTWRTTYKKGQKIDEPWVKLREKTTGQEFFVMSVHDPSAAAQNARVENAKRHVETINKLQKEAPVFIAGDFNQTPSTTGGGSSMPSSAKGAYCMLITGASMQHAYDVAHDRKHGCPNSPANIKGNPQPTIVDHIFMSEGVQMAYDETSKNCTAGEIKGLICGPKQKGFEYIDRNRKMAVGGSDHSLIVASVIIPGSGDGEELDDVRWPLDKKHYDSNKADWLGGHVGSSGGPLGTGTAWGGDNMGTSGKGTDIASDIGNPPDGSPVYAMVGGKVTSTSLCGAGDGVAVKSTINGKTLGIAYMHATGQTVKVGDTVKPGQHIANLGAIGCSVSGGHLHVGIAYGGQYVCPQDVFLVLEKKTEKVDFAKLVKKAAPPCARN